ITGSEAAKPAIPGFAGPLNPRPHPNPPPPPPPPPPPHTPPHPHPQPQPQPQPHPQPQPQPRKPFYEGKSNRTFKTGHSGDHRLWRGVERAGARKLERRGLGKYL